MTSLVPLQPKKGKRRKEKADIPPAVPAKGRKPASSHPCGEHLGSDVRSGQESRQVEDVTSLIIWSGEPHLDSGHN